MKRLFLFLLFLAAIAFAMLPLALSAQSAGDFLFQKKSSSGPLAADWVTPGAPPALFGTTTGGDATSFVLGGGLAISGSTLSASGGAWGSITGTLASQTDLQTALNAKASTASLSSYLTTATAATTYASLSGSYANPAWITSLAWSKLTGVPSEFTPAAHNQAWSTITSTPTTLAGFGIADAITAEAVEAGYLPLTGGSLSGGIQVAGEVQIRNALNEARITFDPYAPQLSITGDDGSINILADNLTGTASHQWPSHTAATKTFALTSNATGLITATDVSGLAASATADTTNASNITSGSLSLSRLAQTSATSGQVIAWNGTAWAPADASASGATLATNTFTGLQQFSGTTHAGLRLNNLTTVQRDALTGSAGMVIWNTTDGRMQLHNGTAWTSGMVRLTGDTMTGDLTAPNITASTKLLVSSATRPQIALATGTTTGIGIASDRVDVWVANSAIAVFQAGSINAGSSAMQWSSNTSLFGNSDGTGRLIQRNGTSAQTFAIANTYTSFTNKEEFEIGWVGNSNVCRLRPIKGSSAGSSRNAEFHTTETGLNWGSGSGSPEGVRTAPIGSLYTRTDGGASTTLYVKESGTGNTGWIAK
jgi:hypothetical protein